MKVGKAVRVALDVALTVMIVFEMLIQFTGEFLHEVVGFAFFATVVVHLAFSAAWVRKTARNAKEGKLTERRTALAVIGCLLAVTMVVLGVSSVAISGILSSAGFVWPVGTYSLWASVHTVSSYALCAIVVVHLAMHWAFLASAMRVPYNPSRRRAIGMGVNSVAALGVLALGVTAAGKMAPQAADAAQGAIGAGAGAGAGVGVGGAGTGGANGAGEGGSAGNTSGAGSVNGTGEGGATGNAGDAGNADGNGAGNAGESSGGNSGDASASGKHGKHRGRHASSSSDGSTQGYPSESFSGSSGRSSNSSSGSSGSSGSSADELAPQSSSGDEVQPVGEDASTATGICTLCRKQCPLSAPRCDRPYEAGLI